ncbi:5'-3' exoribonuclease 2 [Apostasia shenzhenica]|uniref:5'-3' exoribonuclease 2 n=1 Tax=Apostasia shenzhenica TaxID=1088818 RepID=A0A2I0AF70_9ASPA|nr:5'-3' exoribonuclease 2 [Apostasia shenzhenica]
MGVKALILSSSLLESWSTTVTVLVSSLSIQKKLKLHEVRDLILSKDIFKREYGESLEKFEKVYLTDNRSLEIAGEGDVQIRIWNNSLWKMQNVRYIPRLKRNLISICQLNSTDYRTIFEDSS